LETHTFQPHDLVGGDVVVDLVNTVTARNADPIDWLDGYRRALEWAAVTGAFDPGTLATLQELHAADPAAAKRSFRRLVALRETLHTLLIAATEGSRGQDAALRSLAERWRGAVAHTRIRLSVGRARLEVDLESAGLDYISDTIALRAVELLQVLPPGRTRVCDGPRCGWLFIDGSKAGRRRWCDMATCGNAAKSRRYQDRKRRTTGTA
jgi:predicted RNA-binding Zn ribbon-like protein